MTWFQRPPLTAEEVEQNAPLDIPPDEVAKFSEEEWYAKAYRGEDAPQLTLRAVLMGSFLGFFLSFTNLYIGLKTGWHLGVALTACILSYALWQVMLAMKLAKTPMTILENNCMQSTASAAGYSTGGTFVSALAALLMLSQTVDNPDGLHQPLWVYVVWTFFLAMLGVVLAIPMKRNMINSERLKFPSGTAAAATLQSLYSEGATALKKARVLMWAALISAGWKILISLNVISNKVLDPFTKEPMLNDAGQELTSNGPILPDTTKPFDAILPTNGNVIDRTTGEVTREALPSDWTIKLDSDPIMIAAGMLVGLRICLWMAIGGLVLAYVLGPMGMGMEATDLKGNKIWGTTHPGKAWKEIGIWFGVPIMVASGLLSFAFQWKTIVRAIKGFAGGGGQDQGKEAPAEVPGNWFLWGFLFAGSGVVGTAHYAFDIPIHYGIVAVLLTFLLALVACRATGESDITPTGAMGKIMQLTFGVLMPQSTTANLMSAGITAGAASSSADLLTDLKSGYLLGANPKRQFIAQFLGIFVGTAATVFGFYLLVPDAWAMVPQTMADGTLKQPEFPAPAAQAWMAVAKVFELGLDNMHPMHRTAIYYGLGLGTLIILLEKFLPQFKKWLPSATGIGLGMVLPFYYPLAMLVGAIIAEVWNRKGKESADNYLVPVSAGVIAGVSIIGVIVAILNTLLFADVT